jgi:BASS family bile acid:Na+ symporter
MLVGMGGYPLLGKLDFLMPSLIFAMLLLTFCRVRVADLRPRAPHYILLAVELCVAPLAYLALYRFDALLAQAVMVCVICPTATSAAVITVKLGGSAASVSTFTFMANIGTAIVVPLLFPLIEPHENLTFWSAASVILSKVFVLLICPLLLAIVVRRRARRLHRALTALPDLAFYLWTVALAIVTARITQSFLTEPLGGRRLALTGAAIGALCVVQFWLGKTIGGRYGDRISGGQSLGQKNTILAIWMTQTYLNPLAAVGPGFYVLAQNIVNSWQLWKKRKRDEKATNRASTKTI